MSRSGFAATALLIWLCCASPALGQEDPFSLTAQTTTGTPQTITESGSSVIDLVQNLIETQDQFAGFQGQAFTASLDYGGVPDAIQFSRNAAGTSATVTIPSTGFSRTFTGSNEQEVLDEIEDFLLKEGASEYARFLRTVNEQSMLGVVDGNPRAATAMFSDDAFFKFGLHRSPTDAGSLASGTPGGTGLRLDFRAGLDDTEAGDGYHVTGSFSSVSRIGDRVGLALSAPFSYREVEGAEVFAGGLEFSLPIVVLSPFGGRGVVWQLTPTVYGGAAGSEDLAAGGTLFGGGGTSSLSIPLGGSAALTIGNGFYFHEGYSIHIGEYEFETDLSQQVMKHGIMLTQGLGPLSVDVGITYTDFLQEAAVDNYLSPTLGVTLGAGSVGVRVAYQGDMADGFTSHGGMVMVYFNF